MKLNGITNLAKQRVSKSSGGEKQRVFIAKAICQESNIIVLDEPTSFLDISFQIRLMDFISTLVEEKKYCFYDIS